MNLSRAKRRWKAWDRYTDRIIRLCGGHDRAPTGFWYVLNERAYWRNSGNHGSRHTRRFNKRTKRGRWI